MANQGATTLDWAQRLLLVLPTLGDIDLPAEAAEIVAGAITAVGALRRPEDVAGELLAASRRFWGLQEWADRDGAPTCLGQHTFRGAGASSSIDWPSPPRGVVAAHRCRRDAQPFEDPADRRRPDIAAQAEQFTSIRW